MSGSSRRPKTASFSSSTALVRESFSHVRSFLHQYSPSRPFSFRTVRLGRMTLPMKIRILTRLAKQPPWERASPCSREPQVAGQNVVSAARYLVARNSLPQIAVRVLGREHVIDDHQKAVGNRHDCLLLPQTTRQAVVLGGKIVIVHVREHPDHFCQNGT